MPKVHLVLKFKSMLLPKAGCISNSNNLRVALLEQIIRLTNSFLYKMAVSLDYRQYKKAACFSICNILCFLYLACVV